MNILDFKRKALGYTFREGGEGGPDSVANRGYTPGSNDKFIWGTQGTGDNEQRVYTLNPNYVAPPDPEIARAKIAAALGVPVSSVEPQYGTTMGGRDDNMQVTDYDNVTGYAVKQSDSQGLMFDASGNQSGTYVPQKAKVFWEDFGDALGEMGKIALVGAGLYFGLPALASAFGGGAAAAGAGAAGAGAAGLAAGELGLAGGTLLGAGNIGVASAMGGAAGAGALNALGAGSAAGANALGSGAFDAGLGDILSTTAAPTVGQGAVLAPAATAGTGAMGAGLGGAATTAAGEIIGAGTAAAGANALTGGAAGAGNALTDYLTSPAGIQAGASLAGGVISAAGANAAANTQANAADRALTLQREIYDSQKALQEPYRAAGITAQNRLLDYLGLSANTGQAGYGKYAGDFGMADFQADPGYAFRLSEGQKALDRQAAARGGLISGGALKAATRYGQDMGSQEYGNAYNRYQTNRTNQLQPLGNLMASGQSAASNVGSAAGQYGTNAANLINQGGQATAAGQLGIGNTINNAIGAGVSAYQNNNLLDMLRRQNTSSYLNPYAIA